MRLAITLALDFDTLPFGAIVGFAQLVECVPTRGLQVSHLEDAWGNYEAGRYAWKFDGVWRLREPVPCIGRQGLFEVNLTPEEIANALPVEAFTL